MKYSTLVWLALFLPLSLAAQEQNHRWSLKLGIESEWLLQDEIIPRHEVGYSFFNGARLGLGYDVLKKKNLAVELGVDYLVKRQVFRQGNSPFSSKLGFGNGSTFHYLSIPIALKFFPENKVQPFIEAALSKRIFSTVGNSDFRRFHREIGDTFFSIRHGVNVALSPNLSLALSLNLNAYDVFSTNITRWSMAPMVTLRLKF